VKLRAVSSGWVRALFFAVLSGLVFLFFHTAMARSRLALAGFTWTFLGIPAVSLLEELRRRPRGQMPRYQPAPQDAVYESRVSPAPLAWPVALLLWFFVPATIVGGAVDVAIGVITNNVAGAMGALAAVVAGLLGGLGAWLGLRTLSAWRLGTADSLWPLWMEAPRPSVSFRALRAEWPREGVFYVRPREPPYRSTPPSREN
jgi:hypothetical protein